MGVGRLGSLFILIESIHKLSEFVHLQEYSIQSTTTRIVFARVS